VELPKTLLLTETGVEQSPDGTTAVNVGPIVRALKFLTEGRGDDRGADEAGNPLPDLMSLAFDVVESIIVGGPKADYFRQVKQQLEARADGAGRSSLALAKQAKRVQPPAEVAALAHASSNLQALLGQLQGTTAQLLAAMDALGIAPRAKARRKAKAKVKAQTSPLRPRALAKKKTKAALRPAPKRAAKRKRKPR
jgi:hypothetical protein